MSEPPERQLVRYVGRSYDSVRWAGFELRADDVIVTTPPKSGTTWTQMICALLILQETELPAPLVELSPWLDMLTASRTSVFAALEAQRHRRFIKTHTPLSGLPIRDGVTYICVARDPRDVALSMDDHFFNLDWDAFHRLCVAAAREDGLAEPARPVLPALERLSDRERFWRWVDDDTPPEQTASTLLRTLRHFESFWNERDNGQVVLLHYRDLKADLAGQMRALAGRLGIDVPEERWPALVAAASIEEMRRASRHNAPGGGIWHDSDRFFSKGRSGAWRDLLDADDMRRYDARVASLVEADLSAWVHGP